MHVPFLVRVKLQSHKGTESQPSVILYLLMFYFCELCERGVPAVEGAINQFIFGEEHVKLRLMVSEVFRSEQLLGCIEVF